MISHGGSHSASGDRSRDAGPAGADATGAGAASALHLDVAPAFIVGGPTSPEPVVFFVAREDLVLDEANDLGQREFLPADAARQ